MLRNLKLSRKFAVSFGIVCVLCLLQGGAAVVGLFRIGALTRDLTGHTLPAAQALTEMRAQMQTIRRVELASLLCRDETCETKYPPMRSEAVVKYQAARERFEALVSDPSDLSQFHAMTDGFSNYLNKSDVLVKAFLDAGEKDDGSIAKKEQSLLGDFNGALNAAFEMTGRYDELSIRDGELAGSANRILRWVESGVALTVTMLCLGIGMVLTRLIAPPIVAATAALEQVAQKNLAVSIPAQGEDEVGRLCGALNESVASMRSVIQAFEQSVSTLAAAAEELSAQSVTSRSNTESQTSQTNQIASAAQEMSITIGEISKNAETASIASRKSANAANEGGQVVQASSATMEQISAATSGVAEKISSLAERSNEIGKVVSVIQEISEQTNLLALNAAIEAARAGEHGRGFAVVAGEVRRLAERTTAATQEIGGTIRNIQSLTGATFDVMQQSRTAVENGMSETARVRASLDGIIESSNNVEQMIQLIATAATEQSSASAEISSSATSISSLAEQNSRGAGAIAEACNGLAELANNLDSIIGQFRTCDEKGQHGGPKCVEMNFEKAIQAHARWKNKLAIYIAKPDRSIDAGSTSRDDRCDLGKWLHGNGRKYASLPEFGRLVDDHAHFHRTAGDIIRKADAGQIGGEEVALGARSDYAAASSAVVRAIMNIKNGLARAA